MLKKVGLILMILLVLFSFSCVFAETTEAEAERALNSQHTTDLLDMQESTKATLDDYIERYGSKGDQMKVMIVSIDENNGFLRVSYKKVPPEEAYSSHTNSARKAPDTNDEDFAPLAEKLPEWISDALKEDEENNND